ncbi:MAG: hypothetical protein QXM52_06170 [Candidatus Bathyarchaeia archaeon]
MAKDTSLESKNLNIEELIFKTLDHQKRRDILRFIGEKEQATFTEIKNSVGVDDSPSLYYHLNLLTPLVIQKEGKYELSELGHDVYNLLCKITTYSVYASTVSSLRKGLPAAIISNALLWAAAILAVSMFEGRLHQMTISILAVLWFISNIILYSFMKKVKG